MIDVMKMNDINGPLRHRLTTSCNLWRGLIICWKLWSVRKHCPTPNQDAHAVLAVTGLCGDVRIAVFQLPSVDTACTIHIGKIQCTRFRDGLEPIFDWPNYGRSVHIFLYPIIVERSFVKHSKAKNCTWKNLNSSRMRPNRQTYGSQ